MQTDVTLQLLEDTTAELGAEFRAFVGTVCTEIQTRELAAEVAARERRERNRLEKEAKAALKEKTGLSNVPSAQESKGATADDHISAQPHLQGPSTTSPVGQTSDGKVRASKPQKAAKVKGSKARLVRLNIRTPKFHFLGDYVPMIRTFGTSDSSSTEMVHGSLYPSSDSIS